MNSATNTASVGRGALDVLKASGVMFATTLFFPGVLVRMASQLLVGVASGERIVHRNLLLELGGEPESESPCWTALLLATFLGPVLIGSALLFPTVVRSTLLDVRPFAAISIDPGTIVSHDTSVAPFLETIDRFGFLGFLRLWFGVSCFYCSVPSQAIIVGAGEENRSRQKWSPLRLLLAPLLFVFRLLRGIDTVLMVGFAGAYLASGLIVLLAGWRLLSLMAELTLG